MLCSGVGGGGIDIGTPGERAGREWHRKKGRGEGTQATTSREPEGAGEEKPNIKVKIS